MPTEIKTPPSIPKDKYRATAGFDVVAHGIYPEIRIEAGEDPSEACPCHMASRIESGLIELVPAVPDKPAIVGQSNDAEKA